MKMPLKIFSLSAAAVMFAFGSTAKAQTLFNDSFNTDTSGNWTINKSTGANANDAGQIAEFGYNYATYGVPSAPRTTDGSRTGLRLRPNVTGGIFSGFSVSPTAQNFGPAYKLSFDLWTNYIGGTGGLGTGGSGSTEAATAGVGTAGTSAQWAGSPTYDSVFFGNVIDGGTAGTDYRAYPRANNAAPATGAYAAGTTTGTGGAADNTNPYYSFLTSKTAPAEQVALSSTTQSGNSAVGTTSFAWHRVDILNYGGFVEWDIDGVRISTVNVTAQGLGGNNILLGMFDTTAGSPVGTTAQELNFALFDNVSVVAVPEPGSIAALSALVGGLMLRRRRSV
ncbi:MAG: hypothetical protein JWO31_678 [Phycisphaerales bacterium]|nr:hypothetical protein [Phycisphaerales bacterium]